MKFIVKQLNRGSCLEINICYYKIKTQSYPTYGNYEFAGTFYKNLNGTS